MHTTPIPTYDLKGNRITLPPHIPKKDEKIMRELAKEIEQADNAHTKALLTYLQEIIFALKEVSKTLSLNHIDISRLLQEIRDKEIPQQIIPSFPEEIKISNPTPPVDISGLERNLIELARAIENLPPPQVIIQEKQTPPLEPPKEQPNLLRPASGKRIKIKWVIATSPNLAGTESIIGDIDGTNKDFYVSGSPIKNSEQIRLNQGSPLSYGADYTNTANKYSFVVAPPSGSTLEIKWQSR